MDKKNNAKKYLTQSLNKSKEGNYEEALKLIQKAIDLFPNATVFWTFKSEYFFEMKNYEDALKCVDKAIELKDRNFHAWSLKGAIYEGLKDYELSAEAFQKSLEIKQDFNIYTLLANVQMNFDLKSAICNASKALKLNPEWDEAKNILNQAKKMMEKET